MRVRYSFVNIFNALHLVFDSKFIMRVNKEDSLKRPHLNC